MLSRIFPISVLSPVPTTTPVHLPLATFVPVQQNSLFISYLPGGAFFKEFVKQSLRTQGRNSKGANFMNFSYFEILLKLCLSSV